MTAADCNGGPKLASTKNLNNYLEVLKISVHKKLMQARLKLQATKLNKSGHNKFAGYFYVLPHDVRPAREHGTAARDGSAREKACRHRQRNRRMHLRGERHDVWPMLQKEKQMMCEHCGYHRAMRGLIIFCQAKGRGNQAYGQEQP